MFCPKCGATNDDASKFCLSCGGPLEAAAAQTPPAAPPPAPAYSTPAYQPPQTTPPKKSHTGIIVIIVLLLVLAIGAAAVFFVLSNKDEKDDKDSKNSTTVVTTAAQADTTKAAATNDDESESEPSTYFSNPFPSGTWPESPLLQDVPKPAYGSIFTTDVSEDEVVVTYSGWSTEQFTDYVGIVKAAGFDRDINEVNAFGVSTYEANNGNVKISVATVMGFYSITVDKM